jgi:hypothetical protein
MASVVKPSAILYVAVPVLLGQIPAAVAFAVNPDIGMTEVPLAPWVFVVVWMPITLILEIVVLGQASG